MEDAADHLVRDVFPEVPVRQWVLSLPRNLRFLAAREKVVASRLLDLFTRALFFHTLIPDGVFDLAEDGPARFVSLPPPTDEDVAQVLTTVIRKVERTLGRLDFDLTTDEDAFAALQALEVSRQLRLPGPFESPRRSAMLDGFSLHAGVRIHAHDRQGLKRLCRYLLRPPFALERLSAGEEGRLVYKMKRPRGGSLFLLLTPDELLARLATLVPPPRTHSLRYHGLFAPNSKHRARVVPGGERKREKCCPVERPTTSAAPLEPPEPPSGFHLTPPPSPEVPPPETGQQAGPRYRVPWAEQLRKVFALDVMECPRCAGRLELLAFIADGGVARRILDHLGLASRSPPLARARSPDDDSGTDAGPDHDVADPTYED